MTNLPQACRVAQPGRLPTDARSECRDAWLEAVLTHEWWPVDRAAVAIAANSPALIGSGAELPATPAPSWERYRRLILTASARGEIPTNKAGLADPLAIVDWLRRRGLYVPDGLVDVMPHRCPRIPPEAMTRGPRAPAPTSPLTRPEAPRSTEQPAAETEAEPIGRPKRPELPWQAIDDLRAEGLRPGRDTVDRLWARWAAYVLWYDVDEHWSLAGMVTKIKGDEVSCDGLIRLIGEYPALALPEGVEAPRIEASTKTIKERITYLNPRRAPRGRPRMTK